MRIEIEPQYQKEKSEIHSPPRGSIWEEECKGPNEGRWYEKETSPKVLVPQGIEGDLKRPMRSRKEGDTPKEEGRRGTIFYLGKKKKKKKAVRELDPFVTCGRTCAI